MTRSSPNQGHVVVVDDEPLILETACRILEDGGYRTRSADSAEAALGLIDDDTLLLLTDTALGGMSGAALRQRVIDTRPELPVLLMSGMEPDELSAWGVTPSAGSFIAKPFDPDHLLCLVGRLVNGADQTADGR